MRTHRASENVADILNAMNLVTVPNGVLIECAYQDNSHADDYGCHL